MPQTIDLRPRAVRAGILLACPALFGGLALAQSAPSALDLSAAAANANPPREETIVLSPFEVDSAADTGYLATSAQSGTRLRSDLKDIAAAVTVVTKDFMTDINATNLTSLLVYTPGTEVSGPGGNFSGTTAQSTFVDFETQLTVATPQTRVRGLVSADLAQDFFVSYLPTDSYNLDRVEISRGPNAMLFGLGSPGGIINSELNVAKLDRTGGELHQDFGEYGTLRHSLDFNQVLLKDKLALRADTLYDKEYYRQHPSYSQDQRLFLTGTYRPFKNTTIKANAEFGNRNSNQPWDRPPSDGLSMWWQLGKPVYNPITNGVTFLGTPQAPYTTNTIYQGSPTAPLSNGSSIYTTAVFTAAGLGGSSTQRLNFFYSDPASPNPGIPGESFQGIEGQAGKANTIGGKLVNGGLLGLGGYDRFLNRIAHPGYSAGFWRIPMITDPHIFDFYHEELDGPNKYEWAKWQNYEASIDQTFLDNHAGIELAYNRQALDNGALIPLTFDQYQLKVDIDQFLPNGDPNPNLGRPFAGGTGYMYRTSIDAKNARGTAFYDLDLHRAGPTWLGRILGEHVFTGAYTRQSVATESESGYPLDSGVDYSSIVYGGGGANLMNVIHYIGPSMAGLSSYNQATTQPFTGQWPSTLGHATVLLNVPPAAGATAANPWTTQNISIISDSRDDPTATLSSITRNREDVNSEILIAQSKWLDGDVVSTVGWRRDSVWTYDAGNDPYTNTITGALDPNPANFYPKYLSSETQDSTNWGIVVHSPEFINRYLPWGTNLSLSYSRSDNFKVTAQRYNIFDQALGPEIGKTKEYGIRIATFNNKLELKVGHYETADALSSSLVNLSTPIAALGDLPANVYNATAQGYNAGNPAGLAAFNAWAQTPGAQQFFQTFHYVINGPPVPPNIFPTTLDNAHTSQVVGTSDVVSTGLEFEAVVNPNPNWRIAFNATKSEAVRTNTGTDIQSVVNNVFIPLANGPAGTLFTDSTGVNTLAETLRNNVINPLNTITRQDGSPTPELRRWHWNVVTNYNFTHGVLKRFNVAGGVRWEDKAAIGYPVLDDPVLGGVSDVKHPYYSPSLTSYDGSVGYTAPAWHGIRYHVQLYLQNIGVGDELMAVHAQPDGSIDAYEIREPMKWTLANTFKF